MRENNFSFYKLKEIISKEKKLHHELDSLETYLERAEEGEKRMIFSQIRLLKQSFRKTNDELLKALENLYFPGKSQPRIVDAPEKEKIKEEPKKTFILNKIGWNLIPGLKTKGYSKKEMKLTPLEMETIKRMKNKKEVKIVAKERKANAYVQLGNRLFSKLSEKMINEKTFDEFERILIKANMQMTPKSYFSMTFLTTFISVFVGIILTGFFLFFNIEVTLPIIKRTTQEFGARFIKVIWIAVLTPVATFITMYIYPGLEKSTYEYKIDEELPFATINMSAISGSMIDPSKIFDIIISTHEYPSLEKEFKKLLNEINVYGYDLVSALRNSASNSPSKKLSELFTGLATTINSGGYLPEFFEKRAQTFLFEHGLEKEKKTKSAETFMDIYISVVIAAPMILMILLMMMKISGLGVSLSTSMITIIMVLAVTMINIVFLTFLHLKK